MATKKPSGRPAKTSPAARKGPPRRGNPPPRPAQRPAPPPRKGSELAGLLDQIDRAEGLIERLAEAEPAVADARRLLLERRPDEEHGSPLSSAMLVRLAASGPGPEGLVAAFPFLMDGSPWVGVAAAEAIDEASDRDLRAALRAALKTDPDAEFWEPMVDLLEPRPAGVRLMIDVLERVKRPEAQAALIEALATGAEPAEVAKVKELLSGFLDDPRPIPGLESEEGSFTFSLLAAEALDLLEGDR